MDEKLWYTYLGMIRYGILAGSHIGSLKAFWTVPELVGCLSEQYTLDLLKGMAKHLQQMIRHKESNLIMNLIRVERENHLAALWRMW